MLVFLSVSPVFRFYRNKLMSKSTEKTFIFYCRVGRPALLILHEGSMKIVQISCSSINVRNMSLQYETLEYVYSCTTKIALWK